MEQLLLSRAVTLRKDGAEQFNAAILETLSHIRAALRRLPPQQAGVRIHGIRTLDALLAPDGESPPIADRLFG